MSKEEFLKIQTCLLKVNIHCDGCKRKVKKILQKIEGVFTVCIDSEQGKVTVSGTVGPPSLIKKLAKGGKHAEVWGSKQNQQVNNNLFKGMQIDNSKNNKNGKVERGGGNGQKGGGQPPPVKGGGGGGLTAQQMQQLQQLKGFQDMKLAGQFKDMKVAAAGGGGGGKTVKFKMPESDESDDEYDDEDDDDDYDDSEFDDDELDDIPVKKPVMGGGGGGQMMKPSMFMKGGQMPNMMKGGGPQMGNGGGNGAKKGGGGNIPVQINGGGVPGGQNKNGGGDGGQNKGGVGGGQNKGGGGGNMNVNGMSMPNMMSMRGGGGVMGPMGHMGAVQGLPAGRPMVGVEGGGNGYFQGGGQDAMGGHPYHQQQLVTAMMNQQRANGNERFQPMMYSRPPAAVTYMQPYPPYPYPQPPQGDPLSHYFSDENTSSCSVM